MFYTKPVIAIYFLELKQEIKILIMERYLRSFANHSDYTAFTGTSEFVKPNVSLCQQEMEVHYNPDAKPYLTFTATEAGTFKLSGNSVDYSLDNGVSWTTLASDTASPTVPAGSSIMWKATLTPTSSIGIGRFSSTGSFVAEGNPMSLLYGDNFNDQTDLTGKNYAFRYLFSGCTRLTSAENLSLPATTLAVSCYYSMFHRCTSLTTAPSLPATTLATSGYAYMFYYCTSLSTAPELPATTLADYCYSYMFSCCTSLITVPNMSITPSAFSIDYMFSECTSLVNINYMLISQTGGLCGEKVFSYCTSLVDASNLTIKSTSTINASQMFYYCQSLQISPIIDGSFTHSTGRASSGALLFGGFAMFGGCSQLKRITYLGTTLGGYYDGDMPYTYYQYSYSWVSGVASTGTFIKKAGVAITYEGSSACGGNTIPCNWTIVEQ